MALTQSPSFSNRVNRTNLAAWGLLARLTDQAVQTIALLVVTPLVISSLGHELYGAWLIILQSSSNLSRFDLRPLGALRISLAVSQHSHDYGEKRRQIGAAVLVMLIMLPVLVALGTVLVVLTPMLLQLSQEHQHAAQTAMGITGVAVIVAQFGSMPRGILAGTNMYHRGIGVNAVVSLFGAIFVVVAMGLEGGLVGMAIANAAQIALGAGLLFYVAKRALPWLGVAMPSWHEIKHFLGLTSWLFLSGIAWAFINSCDLILIGFLLGPSEGATFALTGTVLRNINNFMYQFRNSVAAGMAELVGIQEWDRVVTLLAETKNISMAAFGVAGATIIILNEPFLELWLGPGFYSDDITNFFLVLAVFADQLVGLDANIVESLLALRRHTIYTVLGGLTFVVMSAVLAPVIGLKGIAFSSFVARIVWAALLQSLILQRTRRNIADFILPIARSFLFCTLLFIVSLVLSEPIYPQTWLSFAIISVLIGSSFTAVMLLFGLGTNERMLLVSRVLLLSPFLRRQVKRLPSLNQ